jgi:transposase
MCKTDQSAAERAELLARIEPQLTPSDYQRVVQEITELERTNRELTSELARLMKMAGRTNSEKTKDVLPPEPSPADAPENGPTAPDAPAPNGEPEKNRKGHGRIPSSAYPGAERTEVKHESLAIGSRCPDCPEGSLYALDPVEALRIFGQPPLLARLWLLEHLRCCSCMSVFTARPPLEAQGPKFDDTAVAMMVLLRYGNGLPLHRLDHLQRHLENPVPASTQWQVVHESTPAFEPVFRELVRLAARAPLLHNDDTYARILEFMGKRRAKLLAQGLLDHPDRTGLFTTGVVAKTDDGKPIVLFFSGRKHAGENLAELLERREAHLPPPILMSDALDRNLPKGHAVVEANCNCHGRRNLVDQVANFPAECRFLLEEFKAVFEVEATCVARKLSPDERLRVHQADSAPHMEAIFAKARALLDEREVEPNSDMGKALNYLLNHWDALTRFMHVPGAPIDNNACERALKMAIRHRNNSLFYKTERGAEVGDLFMSIIDTCVLNDENPFEYLVAILRHSNDVARAPGDWLPWTFRVTLARLSNTAADDADVVTPAARPAPPSLPDAPPRPAASTSNPSSAESPDRILDFLESALRLLDQEAAPLGPPRQRPKPRRRPALATRH